MGDMSRYADDFNLNCGVDRVYVGDGSSLYILHRATGWKSGWGKHSKVNSGHVNPGFQSTISNAFQVLHSIGNRPVSCRLILTAFM